MNTKKCIKCGAVKATSEFYRDNRLKDGLQGRCKICKGEHRLKKLEEYNRKALERAKIRYDKDPEKHRQLTRDWKESQGSKIKEYNKKWHDNKDRFKIALQTSKRSAKVHGYLACSATYDEVVAAFRGKCEICGVPEVECNKKLVMDHDHYEDGMLRGFLCRNCNSALGMFKDNEELLAAALLYLTRSKVKL